jgi:tRNA A37 threonylcarbamoyladenosine dehydratase
VSAGTATELLPADLDRRFGGLARLYGAQGAMRISSAHVVVVGLGGVGSWAAEALARSGVARLTLIDLDHIAESNINRQIHALDNTLGQSKVQAMRERIAHINPYCDVSCVEEFVDSSNWPGIAGLGSEPDSSVSIIDACDQVRAKTAMAAWALEHNARRARDGKVNFVAVGAAGGKRHAHKVEIEDLSFTTHDPLLAQLRYRLRKEHGAARVGKIGLSCVFSREAVMQAVTNADQTVEQIEGSEATQIPAQNDSSLNCHGYGSVVSVTSTFGICAAGWLLGKIAE